MTYHILQLWVQMVHLPPCGPAGRRLIIGNTTRRHSLFLCRQDNEYVHKYRWTYWGYGIVWYSVHRPMHNGKCTYCHNMYMNIVPCDSKRKKVHTAVQTNKTLNLSVHLQPKYHYHVLHYKILYLITKHCTPLHIHVHVYCTPLVLHYTAEHTLWYRHYYSQ